MPEMSLSMILDLDSDNESQTHETSFRHPSQDDTWLDLAHDLARQSWRDQVEMRLTRNDESEPICSTSYYARDPDDPTLPRLVAGDLTWYCIAHHLTSLYTGDHLNVHLELPEEVATTAEIMLEMFAYGGHFWPSMRSILP